MNSPVAELKPSIVTLHGGEDRAVGSTGVEVMDSYKNVVHVHKSIFNNLYISSHTVFIHVRILDVRANLALTGCDAIPSFSEKMSTVRHSLGGL